MWTKKFATLQEGSTASSFRRDNNPPCNPTMHTQEEPTFPRVSKPILPIRKPTAFQGGTKLCMNWKRYNDRLERQRGSYGSAHPGG